MNINDNTIQYAISDRLKSQTTVTENLNCNGLIILLQ